jgi:hypothetical protein
MPSCACFEFHESVPWQHTHPILPPCKYQIYPKTLSTLLSMGITI